jgi:hypothetical protein
MAIRSTLPIFFLLTASSAGAFVACSGDDTNPAGPASGGDSGTTDATVTHDAAANDSASPDAPSTNDAGDAGDAGPGALKHVFYVMMENHGFDEIIGNTADAPYINQLASTAGVATSYFGVTHPSLPNYLAAVSGDFQGIWDDCAAGQGVTCAPEEFVPGSGDQTSNELLTDAQVQSATSTAHWFAGDTIVDQLDTAGISWKAYMQSIPDAGATDEYAPVDAVDAGDGGVTLVPRKLYAQKHDPFMYFSKFRGDATRMQKVVPLTSLDADLAAASSTPGFVWISPDQCHDMHGVSAANANAPSVNLPACAYPADGGLDHSVIGLGDRFLKDLVQKIQASPAWSEPSAIVIVWDEDDYSGYAGCCGSPVGVDSGILGGSRVPAIVITSKNPTHQTVTDPLNHYSLLATLEQLWGLPCLANACNVPAKMTKLFTP